MAIQLAGLLLTLILAPALASYEHYRLPRAVAPQHYNLRILTHLSDSEHLSFEGVVKIRLQVLQNTNNITLHAKQLTIDESRISLQELGAKHAANCIAKTELHPKYEFYIMHLCDPLQAGVAYELGMRFESTLNANNSGYYKSSYKEPAFNSTRWLALTQFSPTLARLAFPCFDEPDFKATFQLTLGYDKGLTGLSNTPIRQCQPHETLVNYIWCEHEPLIKTSTYLVAYAVHNLTSTASITSDTDHKIVFRSWLRADALASGDFSAHFAPRVLAYLEALFNFSVPLGKIDQLISPDHKFSAMENWGLVTFKETAFLYDANVNTQESKESMEKTMAHEYTHQWFGNLVTMSWWSNVWLKEGFSNYFAYMGVDHLLPAQNVGQRTIGTDLLLFFNLDACKNTRAISTEVKTAAEIIENFSDYVYKKGALTVRMLHKMLGDEVFFAGIRKYLQRHAYGNVNEADLWQALAEEAQQPMPASFNLSTAMSSWTLQEGYPMVSVTRNYKTASASLSQLRFLWTNPHRAKLSELEACWWIPLTYVRQSEANFEQTKPVAWLNCHHKAVTTLSNMPSADEWIMLNPQVNAIYRVNYDEHNWQLIIEAMRNVSEFKRIHVLNRAQLVDDLMALAWNGMQSYERTLSLLLYLPGERQFLPWQAALKNFERIAALLSPRQQQDFEVYMRQLLKPLYKRLEGLAIGIHTAITQPALLPLRRLLYKWACRYEVEDCLEQLLQLYDSPRFRDAAVPVDFRDLVYCKAIEHGHAQNFQLLFDRYNHSSSEIEQSTLASAFGCTRNFVQLQQFLDLTLNSTKTHIKNCFSMAMTTALRSEYIASASRKYFFDNAKTIVDNFTAKNLAYMPMIANDIETISDYALLKLELKRFNQFDKLVAKTLEAAQINIHWRQLRSHEFHEQLLKFS